MHSGLFKKRTREYETCRSAHGQNLAPALPILLHACTHSYLILLLCTDYVLTIPIIIVRTHQKCGRGPKVERLAGISFETRTKLFHTYPDIAMTSISNSPHHPQGFQDLAFSSYVPAPVDLARLFRLWNILRRKEHENRQNEQAKQTGQSSLLLSFWTQSCC